MAFLSLVTGVVDSTGERVDLPQTDGTYLPVRIKLGLNLSGTPATNGGQTDITLDAATVTATYAQIQAALATADSDLEVGNSYGVAADHYSAGGDPALSGALRTSGGQLVTYRDTGVDYAALQGSATLVTLGNSSSDAEILLGTGKSLTVTLNGTGTQLEVGSRIKLYHGATTHAAATGEVGLDATGHLTVWTGGAESSLVAQSDTLTGDLSGSLGSTPQVVGLRGVSIDATPPALNQVLAYDGTNWKATTSSGGGGATLYPASGAHDLGLWTFGEASGNFANSGSAGSLDLVPGGTTPAYGQASPLGAAPYVAFTGTYASTIESAATALCAPTAAATLHVFFYLYDFSASYLQVFGNASSSTVFPLVAAVFDGGQWYANIKTVDQGQISRNQNTSFSKVRTNEWTLLSVVYDGSNVKVYRNGGLVDSATATGGLVYTGTDYIVAGSSALDATWRMSGKLGFMRIRDVADSAADVRLAYRHAMAWAV